MFDMDKIKKDNLFELRNLASDKMILDEVEDFLKEFSFDKGLGDLLFQITEGYIVCDNPLKGRRMFDLWTVAQERGIIPDENARRAEVAKSLREEAFGYCGYGDHSSLFQPEICGAPVALGEDYCEFHVREICGETHFVQDYYKEGRCDGCDEVKRIRIMHDSLGIDVLGLCQECRNPSMPIMPPMPPLPVMPIGEEEMPY